MPMKIETKKSLVGYEEIESVADGRIDRSGADENKFVILNGATGAAFEIGRIQPVIEALERARDRFKEMGLVVDARIVERDTATAAAPKSDKPAPLQPLGS